MEKNQIKNQKILKILLAINVVFLLGIFLSKDPMGLFENTFEDADPFFSKVSEENPPKKIIIKHFKSGSLKKNLSVILKEDGTNMWKVKGNNTPQFVADFKASVKPIFEKFADAKKFVVISSRKEMQKSTDTSEKANTMLVEFQNSAGKSLQSFYVGKTTSGGNQTYVREKSSSTIYAVNGNFNSLFNKKLVKWRDKSIFFKSLSISSKAKKIQADMKDKDSYILVNDASIWKIEKPIKFNAEKSKVENILRKLTPLKASKIITDKKLKQKYLSVKKYLGQVKIDLKEGGTQVLYILAAKYPKIKKDKKKTKDKVKPSLFYVTNTEKKYLYTVYPSVVYNLFPKPDTLKEKKKKKKDNKAKLFQGNK